MKIKTTALFTALIALLGNVSAQFNFDAEGYERGCKHADGCRINSDYFQFQARNELHGQYDMKFFFLDLEVSDNSRDISGNVTINSVVTAAALDTFALELVSVLSVDSILVNGESSPFLRQGDDLLVIPGRSFNAGEQISVRVFYGGTAPLGSSFFAGVTTDSSQTWGTSVTWTLSEPYQAREWWPVKPDLQDKADSAWIFLTADEDNMAASQGLLTAVTPMPGNKLRYEWKTNYPIVYYLISFAVADYQEYNIYAHPEGYDDSILIQNFIYDRPGILNAYKEDIDKTADLVEFLSEKYSLYPFAGEKYGHALTTLPGGMEHQTMSTMGGFPFTLNAHELGHQWFGDNVTCASWSDIWINEGFAEYSEYLANEEFRGYDVAQQWLLNTHIYAKSVPWGSVYVPEGELWNIDRIFNYGLSYAKGSLLNHMIRWELNDDEVFFQVLQDFQAQYSDSSATGMDFKAVLEEVSGREFDEFFDQWYYGRGHPVFDITWNYDDDSLYITSTQTTANEVTPLFKLTIPLHVRFQDGTDTTYRIYQEMNLQSFSLPIDRAVEEIRIDPDQWILHHLNSLLLLTEELDNPVYFTLGPNPATDYLSIFLNHQPNKNPDFTLTDITGRVSIRGRLNKSVTTIDTGSLPAGVYLVRVSDEKGVLTRKIVKN